MRKLLFILQLLFSTCAVHAGERIALWHDKGLGCFPGDSIHVKVNLQSVDGSEASGVAYVDLLTPKGVMLQKLVLKIVDGKADGVLHIDSIFPSGWYEIRAYTRWMVQCSKAPSSSPLEESGQAQLMVNGQSSMFNEGGSGFSSVLLPVFNKEDRELVMKGSTVRHIDMKSHKGRSSRKNKYYAWNWLIKKPQYQLKEEHVTFVGHLVPKNKYGIEWKVDVANKKMYVIASQGKIVTSVNVTTDSVGSFACAFPDLKGEWQIYVGSMERVVKSRYRVINDCLFSPPPTEYNESDLNVSGIELRDDGKSRSYDFDYYDCEGYVEMNKSLGKVQTDLFEWLHKQKADFTYNRDFSSPQTLNNRQDSVYNTSLDLNLLGSDSNDRRTVCADGPEFVDNSRMERRPIVWIVNGCYRLITGLKEPIRDFKVLRPTKLSLPLFVDEVRSVVIMDNPKAYTPYVRCSVLDKCNPITIMLNLQDNMLIDDSNMYSGHIYGF